MTLAEIGCGSELVDREVKAIISEAATKSAALE